MSRVSFIRHTFWGLLDFPILTGQTTILSLLIPLIIAQQYNSDEVSCGLTERGKTIADFTSRRDYATDRAIALGAKL